MNDTYTFGDNDRASARLRRLAETYEAATRALLGRRRPLTCELAVDLGCGPGWSTKLLHDVLHPARAVGLDASERFIAEALAHHGPGLEFHVHDVRRAPFPAGRPDVLLCRFLLTHLSRTEDVLTAWAAAAAPGACLFVHETEALHSEHPTLRRYYQLLAEMQRQHGQVLDVGAHLDRSFAGTAWQVRDSRTLTLDIPAARMAELHLANLRTWREDPRARRSFDPSELDALDAGLEELANGGQRAEPVRNLARQIVATLGS